MNWRWSTVAAVFVVIGVVGRCAQGRDIGALSPGFVAREFSTDATACRIFVNRDVTDPQPLILRPDTDQFVLPPDAAGIIRLGVGEAVELFCTSQFAGALSGQKPVLSTCNQDGRFLVDSTSYRFREFTCSSPTEHLARRSGRTCHNNATLVEVGFVVEQRFALLMEICHDENELVTHYVKHRMTAGVEGFQRAFPRPDFVTGDFFGGRNMLRLYTRATQRRTIARQIGGAQAARFIHETGDVFLARGHLAARADFVFGPHQHGTFYYMNVAPQWQVFNGGNWEMAESSLRAVVSERAIDVDVWTGTFGVTTLPDDAGTEHQIFLDTDQNNNGLIPVPKLYYKVVVHAATNSGIVLIGVNNPHLTLDVIQREYVICNDVADQIDWIKWDRFNLKLGYSYACQVDEFVRAVGHLPAGIAAANLLL